MMHKYLLVIALLLLSGPAQAQTGPWAAVFPANPDHAAQDQGVNIVDRYELVVTPQGGTPLAPHPMGKPAPVNGIILVDVDAYITKTLKAGVTYTSVVQAVGPGGQAVSAPSAPFQLTGTCAGEDPEAPGYFTSSASHAGSTDALTTVEVRVTRVCDGMVVTGWVAFYR